MLQCETCMFSEKLENGNFSCKRVDTKIAKDGVALRSADGFPKNFPPSIGDACNGYIPEEWDLKTASDFEIYYMFVVESKKLEIEDEDKVMLRNEGLFKNISAPDDFALAKEQRKKISSLLKSAWTLDLTELFS